MYIANQMKDDLLKIIHSSNLEKGYKEAAEFLENWDNSVHAESSGGVLFADWFDRYQTMQQDSPLYRIPWSFDDPMRTPRGVCE